MDKSKKPNKLFPYYIIEFVNRGRKPKIKSIDVVVSSWLAYNEKQKKCITKYPDLNLKDYEQCLRNLTPPDSNWKTYTCIIRGRADTVQEALSKANALNKQETVLTASSEETYSDTERKNVQSIRQHQLMQEAKRFKQDINSQKHRTSLKDPNLSISKCIFSMLKMFLIKEVATKYVAVKKMKDKKVMRKTNFYSCIEGLIKEKRQQSNLSVTDKEFVTGLSNVLTNASAWKSSLEETDFIDTNEKNADLQADLPADAGLDDVDGTYALLPSKIDDNIMSLSKLAEF